MNRGEEKERRTESEKGEKNWKGETDRRTEERERKGEHKKGRREKNRGEEKEKRTEEKEKREEQKHRKGEQNWRVKERRTEERERKGKQTEERRRKQEEDIWEGKCVGNGKGLHTEQILYKSIWKMVHNTASLPPNQSIHIIAGVHGGNLPRARGEKERQTDR
jgi:hypothetical protein